MFDIKLTETDINHVINELKSISDFDFVDYAFSFKMRKIVDFMKSGNILTVDEFVYRLNKSENLTSEFAGSFFIPQSELFRDPELWNYLQEKTFPKLLLKKEVKIHLPVCIGGEDLYSLIIFLGMFPSKHVSVSVSYPLERNENEIKNRTFGIKDLKACQKNIELLNHIKNTEDVFIGHSNNMIINHSFKGEILFEMKYITEQQHISEFDLVLFRNRMIYYNDDLQNEVLKNINASLNKGGLLVIGEKELLGKLSGKFKKLKTDLSIYKKKIF